MGAKYTKNVDERYVLTDEWCFALVFHRLFRHGCIILSVMVCSSIVQQSKKVSNEP